METIEIKDAAPFSDEEECFGKAPQPWQLRNDWLKPKRKRKKAEIDLWKEEG